MLDKPWERVYRAVNPTLAAFLEPLAHFRKMANFSSFLWIKKLWNGQISIFWDHLFLIL